MATFGERLKQLRFENKIMQKDLAAALSITPRALKYYEDNRREPTLRVIGFLCGYFNCSADYLLGLSDIPSPIERIDPHDER